MRLSHNGMVSYDFIGNFLKVDSIKSRNFILKYFSLLKNIWKIDSILSKSLPIRDLLFKSQNLLANSILQMSYSVDLIIVYPFKQLSQRMSILFFALKKIL